MSTAGTIRACGHSPARAAVATGIDAATIRRMANEFADAPAAVCYGRVGTTLQSFGTLNQWLVQLLNLVTGNLDREGGALLTSPVFPMTGPGTRPGQYAKQSHLRTYSAVVQALGGSAFLPVNAMTTVTPSAKAVIFPVYLSDPSKVISPVPVIGIRPLQLMSQVALLPTRW